MDLSVQAERHGIKIAIFGEPGNMPICGARDLILIRNAKVSTFNSQRPMISLTMSRLNGDPAVSLSYHTIRRQFM
jgi:hypothetical protein